MPGRFPLSFPTELRSKERVSRHPETCRHLTYDPRQVHHQQPCNDFEEVLLMGGEPVITGHSGLDGEGTGFRYSTFLLPGVIGAGMPNLTIVRPRSARAPGRGEAES